MGGQAPERGPQRLVLYDLKADKEISELPIHQRNAKLDDCETQWTADGRYLYYYDWIVLKPGEGFSKLPIRNRRGNTLDDGWTQWAAAGPPQGSYPVAFNAAGQEEGKTIPVTRVWDRVAGKQVGLCLNAVAVGPGPTPTSMFLAGLSAGRKGFWIHDAGSGEKHRVGDLSTKLIHAWGSKVLYVRPKNMASRVFLGEVVERKLGGNNNQK